MNKYVRSKTNHRTKRQENQIKENTLYVLVAMKWTCGVIQCALNARILALVRPNTRRSINCNRKRLSASGNRTHENTEYCLPEIKTSLSVAAAASSTLSVLCVQTVAISKRHYLVFIPVHFLHIFFFSSWIE